MVFANLNLNNETPKSNHSEIDEDYKQVELPQNLGTLTIDKELERANNNASSSQTLVKNDTLAGGLKANPSLADDNWEVAPKQKTATPVSVQIQLLQSVGEDSKREDSKMGTAGVAEPMQSLHSNREDRSNKSCGTTSNF